MEKDYGLAANFVGNFEKDKTVFDSFRIPFILSMANDEIEVTILRSSLWFYKDQKTTLGEVRKYFTPDGILSLLKDGFIKVKEA